MRGVLVGVDAGGTSTVAACANGGERFTTVLATSANPVVCGIDRSIATICAAIDDVLRGANAGAIAVGVAGAGRDEVAAALRVGLERRYADARIAVVDDARIALRAAVEEGDGIVLIAGTGSIAYGEIAGARYRAGGYGYAIGDDGSGYAIGAAALRLLARAFDGRSPHDAMTAAIAEHFGAAGIVPLLSAIYEGASPVSTVAAVAPIVLQHADAGERSATKIVQTAAIELFDLVRTVWRTGAAGDRELPLAFCGGLLRENGMLTFLLESRLGNELPFAQIRKGYQPVDGALAIAARMASSP